MSVEREIEIGTLKQLVTIVVATLATGCVHTQLDRLGRSRLDGGGEGRAPIVAATPVNSEEVALVSVQADGVATTERLTRHLQRKASLLGCDALTNVVIDGEQGQGTCLRSRHLVATRARALTVVDPSTSLLAKAGNAGAEGVALLAVLDQVKARRGTERGWPLRWYLETYPDSPFKADVEALLVPVLETAGAPSAIRAGRSAE
jgi:hypothetical protein